MEGNEIFFIVKAVTSQYTKLFTRHVNRQLSCANYKLFPSVANNAINLIPEPRLNSLNYTL